MLLSPLPPQLQIAGGLNVPLPIHQLTLPLPYLIFF
jgi:hypothetical protein